MKQKLWPAPLKTVNIVDRALLASLRKGLMLAVPFILAGSVSLLLRSLPIERYQIFLQSLFGGLIYDFLFLIHKSTIGSLSLILMITVSYAYSEKADRQSPFLYPVLAVSSYMAFTYNGKDVFSTNIFDVSWMFTALLVTVVSCALFDYFYRILKITKSRDHSGFDSLPGIAFSYTLPGFAVLAFFSFSNLFIRHFSASSDFNNIGSEFLLKIFDEVGNNFFGALLFIFLVHILWFFGIHGNNILEPVAQAVFQSKIEINAQLLQNGKEPVYPFTKTFFDVFVLMGGSGCCLCLIIAVLIVARKSTAGRLGRIALVPALFNISEIMMFGFPVIYNPIMLFPFLITPIVVLCTSSLATYLGVVPVICKTVEWTTPIILSGYYATGSIAGSILQIFNLILGILIYIPFVKISEKRQYRLTQKSISETIQYMMECERKGITPDFSATKNRYHATAQMLTYDLRVAFESDQLQFHYQPQVTYDGTVFGVEALLRWDHPVYGQIYPPLVITLAKEGGFLDELGYSLLGKACRDASTLSESFTQPLKISVNVVPSQLEDDLFCERLKQILEKYDLKNITLGIELTEQIALLSTKTIHTRLSEIRKLGANLIMDDFGMGHSSMMYLHNNQFDYVKLDGNLVKRLLDNRRSLDIIRSINQLAKSLHFKLVAEYVETLEQRDLLYHTGCSIYQGYLYCKAVPLAECIRFIKNMDTK